MPVLSRYLLLLLMALLPLQGWAAAARMANMPASPVVSSAEAGEHCDSAQAGKAKPTAHADCLECGQCSICHPPLLGVAFIGVPHRSTPPAANPVQADSHPPQPLFRPPISA